MVLGIKWFACRKEREIPETKKRKAGERKKGRERERERERETDRQT